MRGPGPSQNGEGVRFPGGIVAKRFTDSEKWKKAWFRKLGSGGRDLWFYIHDNCDNAGLLEIDLERFSFELGCEVTIQRIKEILKENVLFLSDSRIFLPAFIEFQYGELKETNKPHQSVIKKLQKEGLWKGLGKGLVTLKDKEEEEDKDMDKEKDKEKDMEKEKTRQLVALREFLAK